MGEPSHLSPLFHRGQRGHWRWGGRRARENQEALPSFVPCYLMLLFPTRQMGVSGHHHNRLQATRTTKASSSVTTSQVSKASLHRCLPSTAQSPGQPPGPSQSFHPASPRRGPP